MTVGILPSNKSAGQRTVDLGIGIDRAFAAGEIETTDWVDVSEYTQIWLVVEAGTLGFGELQWANTATKPSATPPATDLLETVTSNIAAPELSAAAFNGSLLLVPFGRWFRARWTQDPNVGGDVRFSVHGIIGPSRIPVTQVGFPFDNSDRAVPVKAAQVRLDPTNVYVNQRQGGVHPDLSTDDPLTANGVFRSTWVDIQGFASVAAIFRSDVNSKTDGARLYFAREVFTPSTIASISASNPPLVTTTADHGLSSGNEVLLTGIDGDAAFTALNDKYVDGINVLTTTTFELVGEDTSTGVTPPTTGSVERVRLANTLSESYVAPNVGVFPGEGAQDGFVRLEYTNGPVAQQRMLLHTSIYDVPLSPSIRSVGGATRLGTSASTTHAILRAHYSDTANPVSVHQDLPTRGLHVYTVGHDVKTPIQPLKAKKASQINVTSLAATQANLQPTTEMVGVKNMDANENIFIGFESGVTANSGWLISPLLGDSFPIRKAEGDELWIIGGQPVASTSNTDENPTTITNNGAVNPNNALLEDGAFATLDNQADSLDADGYAAPGAFTDISKVQLGVKARANPTPTISISHVATVTGTAINTPAVSTATVTSNAMYKYMAAVSFTDLAQNVSSVSGLGLTWTFVAANENDTRVEVWQATGTPTGDGVVTASLSAAAGDACIAVSSYMSVDGAAIEATATFVGSSNDPNGTVNADAVGDMVYAVSGQNRYLSSPGSGVTERADFGTGTGPADCVLTIMDATVVASGPQSITSTLSGTDGWTLVLVSLNKGAGIAPTITLSHDQGPTTLVQQLDGTNTRYLVDVTGDVAWDATAISNAVVTVELTSRLDIDAEIDWVYLEITEIDTGGLVRVSLLEFGE